MVVSVMQVAVMTEGVAVVVVVIVVVDAVMVVVVKYIYTLSNMAKYDIIPCASSVSCF